MKFSTAEFLSDFVEPHGQQVETGETYHYVDHTDDVGILAYPKDTYVFASVPLRDLLTQVTVSQARVLVKRHNVSCGSRDSLSAIQARLQYHNELCCIHNKTVFIKRVAKAKTSTERRRKHFEAKSKRPPDASDPKSDGSSNFDFPPAPLDKNLRCIIEQACN